MTEPGATTTNFAADSAHIGVQAGIVHGGVHVYTPAPDASPREKFEAGVRLLEGGAPRRAWRLIHEAVMAEYLTDEVRFYWLLALLSGRSWHELPEDETVALRYAPSLLHPEGEDPWADGVRLIRRLLNSAQKPDADVRVLMKDLDALGDPQHAALVRHLELFLDRRIQDEMWLRALAVAKRDQKAYERVNRVWKFFEPDPAAPRVRPARPRLVTATTWILAVGAAVVLAAAALHIGYLLARAGRLPGLIAYSVSIIGGLVGAPNGAEWRFRVLRRQAKESEYRPSLQHRGGSAPEGGFARKVDTRYEYYFNKYVPDGVDRNVWLSQTAGIRKHMRDELVEIYRESRISAEAIFWLIRYQVGRVEVRFQNGTLWDYRRELVTPVETKVRAVFGATALAGGGICAVYGAVVASPLNAARSTVFLLLAGWIAARAWLHIIIEHRRAAADKSEERQVLEDREEAFERWQEKLADKPEDAEMAAWLDCDRKVLLDEVLRHYRLSMSNVIAHACVEAPGDSTKRARVLNGPWRYTKYRLLLFLLTSDGVRQLSVELNFERGTFHERKRTNYRYEAVAAVHVSQGDNDRRTFQLALVNGLEIDVEVIGAGMEALQPEEDPGTVSEVTLDAAGMYHTLHVLEGIAAEGKQWISRERRRGEARTKNFTAAMRSPEP